VDESGKKTVKGLTLKALLIGVVLSIIWYTVFLFLGGYVDVNLIDIAAPYRLSIFLPFVILILIVSLLRVLNERLKLNAQEYSVIYAMLLIGTVLVSVWGPITFWPSSMLYFTNSYRANINWIPSFWSPTSENIVGPALSGGIGIFKLPWNAWMVPLAFWMVMAFALVFFMVFTGLIMQKRWIETERLPFPYAEATVTLIRGATTTSSLPEIVSMKSRRWKIFWLALAAGFLLSSNYVLRAIDPRFAGSFSQVDFNLVPFLGSTFKNSALSGRFDILTLGLLLLFPTDFLLTTWVIWVGFFVILPPITVAMGLWAYQEGITTYGVYQAQQYIEPQIVTIGYIGGLIGLGLWYVIYNYRYFGKTIKLAFRSSAEEEKGMPLSYRYAWLGALGCFAVLCSLSIASGWPIIVAVLFFLYFWLTNIGASRTVAEGGGLSLLWFGAGTDGALSLFWRAGNLTPNTGTAFQTMNLMANIDWVGTPGLQGLSLEPYRVSFLTGTRNSDILKSQTIGIIIAILLGFPLFLIFSYQFGFTTGWSQWSVHQGEKIKQSIGISTDGPEWAWTMQSRGPGSPYWQILVGIALIGVLMFLRLRIAGFPLNPAAVPFGASWDMAGNGVWATVIIGWALKWLLFKVGGVKAYKEYMEPVALGLIIGSAFTMLISVVLSALRLSGML